MKIYDRVPSQIDIPVGVEIELEPGEELYFKYRPMLGDKDDWVHACAGKFRIMKEPV